MKINCPHCGQPAATTNSTAFSQHRHSVQFQCSSQHCKSSFAGTLELVQGIAPNRSHYRPHSDQNFELDC